jgi:type VI secretion system protein VasJ
MASNQNWQWAAFGKHPAARDYFRLGENHPLIKGFSDWIENGYQFLTEKKRAPAGPYAWRFWARGSNRENLVCGLVRDSSDSLGRPYPLLIIGTGLLRGWNEYWDVLPFVCEGTWNQMESLSARTFSDLEHFGDEMGRINPPQSHWSEFKNLNDQALSPAAEDLKKRIGTMANENEMFLSLDEEESMNDPLKWIHLHHSFLKPHLPETVTTAFMGGDPLKTWIVFFRRPLLREDFIRLWSCA